MVDRPAIPEGIKRLVRQRCAFGCVICGMPLYDYDHIADYSEVRDHEEANITLLCPTHHDEKKRRRLTREQVAAANARPRNLKSDATPAYQLHYGEEEPPQIWMAGNVFLSDVGVSPIMIDGVPVLKVYPDGDRHFFFDMALHDQYNWPVLIISRNELQVSTGLWDVEYVGTRLTIRSEPRNIFLVLDFQVPNKLVVERGRILLNGVEVQIEPDELRVEGQGLLSFSGSQFLGPIGLQIGWVPPHIPRNPQMLRLDAVNRYRRT